MRPIRLELEGFTAFREPAVVDFDGCEYFALCGPTGAGKSSVIDAICFALYGAVPRLDKGSVSPIVSQGLLEAKVRLDFSAGDQVYTTVRVVARTRSGGATTREARLESAGTLLAGDARSVTAHVERILGLTFDQFTKCVVLPQGEFARFLHDTPADRGDLLVRLLDLEIYGRMAARARETAAAAAERAAMLRQRLDVELHYATEASRGDAEQRLAVLRGLNERVEAAAPQIDALDREVAEGRAEAATARERVERLSAIAVPDGVSRLADSAREAAATVAAAEQAAAGADAARTAADRARAALPERSAVERALETHRERDAAAARLDAAASSTAAAAQAEAQAFKAAEAAREAAVAAGDRLEAVRFELRAHDLARTLVAGDECPVCRQVVVAVPDVHVPADLTAAERAAEAAEKKRAAAEAKLRAASSATAAADAAHRTLAETLAELDRRIGSGPDPATLAATLEAVAAAESGAARAAQADAEARAALAGARRGSDQAAARERDARAGLGRVRDTVADLGAPVAEGEDLAADWETLAGWARDRAEAEAAAAGAAEGRAADAQAERRRLAEALASEAEAASVPVGGGRVRDAVRDAVRDQEKTLERIDAALEEIAHVRMHLKAADEEESVASSLAKHLSARGFEKWMLDEALGRLVVGATVALRELSSGAYSLDLDPKTAQFTIVDHRNADETRSAKTLSGGETFLASLALALALSEDLAQMAAEGARLDAIFLDEGFGTLDPETLDIVAAAIESLAASGRMVGLVTHVRDIAERVGVRFEVRKGPDTARVERVDA